MGLENLVRSPNHWPQKILGDVCELGNGKIQTGPFGSQLHASDYVTQGIPFVMPKNITVERIDLTDIAYISEQDAQRLSKHILKVGDIIYSRRGDVEKCALITETEEGWLCGSGCVRIRLGSSELITHDFLHAYLAHPSVREWIVRHAVGATMPNLNTSILSALPISIPSKHEQEFIGSFWRDAIHKIELNRQMNRTLEAMAQAIFKSWFVDFEPVKAKQQARAAGESVELAAMMALSGKSAAEIEQLPAAQQASLAETAGLFPERLVESELGLIPEGWEVDRLQNVTHYLKRGIQPKYLEEGGVRVVNQKCIRDHQVNFDKARRHNPDKRSIKGRELQIGDILINSTGTGTLGRIAQVLYLNETTIADSHVTIVRANPDLVTAHYLGLNLTSRESDIEALGRGSTGQTELSRVTLSEMEVITPPLKIQVHFEQLVAALRQRIIANELESFSLSQLRDTLLPKLLSGELTIPDAMAQTEEVLS